MSVFYDDRGRDRDYADAAASQAARRVRWGALRPRRPHQPPARPRAETRPAPLWGLTYDRAEGVIQLLLAFALVGGATAFLSSSQFSGAPAAPTAPAPAAAPAREAAARPAPKAATNAEVPAQVPPQVRAETPAATLSEPAPLATASVAVAAPDAAASTPRAAADAAALFDSRPIAGPAAPEAGPRPLAPPNAEARERLAVQDAAPAPAVTTPAAVEATPAEAAPAAETAHEAKAAEGGRLTKCYLKISGRPTENSSCRIRQSERQVVFDFDDKSLVLAHERGRVWSATMGGRALGKVYQNAHKPCWGARSSGFYACDNT